MLPSILGLFGTNIPMVGYARALDDLDALGLDDGSRELFLSGNARCLLHLNSD